METCRAPIEVTNVPDVLPEPLITSHTADGYAQAHRALVALAQKFLDTEDGDSTPMFRHARQLSQELSAHDFRPREKLTRSEVHRNALRRTIDAIYEFADLEHHDGALVSSWKIWEEFQRAIKGAARSADSYGPDDTTWAPEDDTNPQKTFPVPEPDPTAEPINGLVRQGEHVADDSDRAPRRVLTGVDERGFVRLSDPKDGGWFGGHFVPAKMIGTVYRRIDPPTEDGTAGVSRTADSDADAGNDVDPETAEKNQSGASQ